MGMGLEGSLEIASIIPDIPKGFEIAGIVFFAILAVVVFVAIIKTAVKIGRAHV